MRQRLCRGEGSCWVACGSRCLLLPPADFIWFGFGALVFFWGGR